MNKFKPALFIFFSTLILIAGIYLISRCEFDSNYTPSVKSEKDDIWEILNWKFTVIFGFIASFLALFQAIFSTTQKYKELRWSKANLAIKLVDELYDVELAHNALKMTDQMNITYSDKPFKITISDISVALSNLDASDEKSIYIRNCFDTLFYYFERIEHSINIGVVDFIDIKSFFAYYMEVVKKHKSLLVTYCEFIKYFEAVSFIERFS